MIIGILHKGSGLGDQLFSYIATRVRAADLEVPFGFVGKEFWKGKGWMDLDFGKEVDTDIYAYFIEQPSGKLTFHSNHKVFELNKSYYDPEFNFIPDGSVIDGYGAQDIRYFEHRLDEVREWLKVEPLDMPDDLCVLNIRGTEYRTVKELFLPKSYWDKCIEKMKKVNSKMKFVIHTEDLALAHDWFPEYQAIHSLELNWKNVRFAKYLVLSNSAFGVIPALIGSAKTILSPRYWAGYNTRVWNRPNNFYKRFTYID